jgi:hypothetical protein
MLFFFLYSGSTICMPKETDLSSSPADAIPIFKTHNFSVKLGRFRSRPLKETAILRKCTGGKSQPIEEEMLWNSLE